MREKNALLSDLILLIYLVSNLILIFYGYQVNIPEIVWTGAWGGVLISIFYFSIRITVNIYNYKVKIKHTGDIVKGDKIEAKGDVVKGDKVGGDKIGGNQVGRDIDKSKKIIHLSDQAESNIKHLYADGDINYFEIKIEAPMEEKVDEVISRLTSLTDEKDE